MPVEWSRLALEDLRSLRLYNNRRSSNSGTRMARKIRSTVNRLLSEELDLGHTGRVSRTRELVIPNRVHLEHFEILLCTTIRGRGRISFDGHRAESKGKTALAGIYQVIYRHIYPVYIACSDKISVLSIY